MPDEYFAPLVMTPSNVLSRFHKVRQSRTGSDGVQQWTACCPAHDDKSPSLLIGLTSDGRWLFYCRAGCGASDVAHSVGLSLADLFPHNGIGNDGAYRGFGGVRGTAGAQKPHEERVKDTALEIARNRGKRGVLTEAERREAIEILKSRKGENWPVSANRVRR